MVAKARAHEAAGKQRQQELDGEVKRLLAELQGCEKAAAGHQVSLNEQMVKAAAALEREEQAVARLQQKVIELDSAKGQQQAVNAEVSAKLKSAEQALADQTTSNKMLIAEVSKARGIETELLRC